MIKAYQKWLPGLSDSCLKASEHAFQWAKNNPGVAYEQEAINKRFTPPITTGTYGDRNFTDELIWAAAELYITTGNIAYYKSVNMFPDSAMPIPSWANVRLLAYYDLLRNQDRLTGVAKDDLPMLRSRMISLADGLIAGVDNRPYRTVMGKSPSDFGWGSNSFAANQGIALIQVYRLTGNQKYLDYAAGNLDYILGRNAAGYAYVTGYGSKSPMHPHHRPSKSDGIVEPVPGLLVAGANPGMQDGIKTASKVPDEAYIDDDRAYSVNEIAINWNAPLAYLVNALEAIKRTNTTK